MPQVQIIQATKSHAAILENRSRKLRVAAYARVSTEKDEQENSYETQIQYFTNLIKSNPNYIFVDMYADEGLTGTMLKKRTAFNRMLQDAMSGKIDVIYVKSISRFARNTVDLLCTCRDLKSKGVNVIFEKENIELLSSNGELILTIFASIAQEESHSISENIKWTIHKNYEKGIYHMPYKGFLGFEKGEDGKPKIVEAEAEIIRRIYKMYLYGYSANAIAKMLTEEGIKTPRNKNMWRQSTIRSILTNEKYCGDARLQKKYTANFLDHKPVVNEGQIPSYYVTDDHEAIVSHEVFDLVQEMMQNTNSEQKNSGDMFSKKLYCSCGAPYGRKVHHSNDKYRCVIYRCNHEYQKEHAVRSARLKEAQIKDTFVKAVNKVIAKDTVVQDVLEIAGLFEDNSELESDLAVLYDKRKIIEEEIKKLVEDSSKSSEIESFRKRYDALSDEYEKCTKKAMKIRSEIDMRKNKYQSIHRYAQHLIEIEEPITEFADELWFTLLDRAQVKEHSIIYRFRDGAEIEIEL